MDPRILGALIGGGLALAGVVLTLFMQGRRENRHRFTVHRQKSYAKFYLLSNRVRTAHIRVALRESKASPSEGAQAESKAAQSEEIARAWVHRPEVVAELKQDLERMWELNFSFAIMCPYPLRKASRAVLDDCIAVSRSLEDPEKAKQAMSRLTESQVRFVNLARKDLGVTPWWKPTLKPNSWLRRLQVLDLRARDAAEKNERSDRDDYRTSQVTSGPFEH